MLYSRVAAISFILLATACTSGGTAGETEAPPPAAVNRAQATLFDAQGRNVGTADLTQRDEGLDIAIRLSGVSPGVHAAHIHMTGRCDPPDFTSAGGHWNPYGRQHGRDNPAGQHMGDMPNIIVGQNGVGLLEATITGGELDSGPAPLFDGDGAAVMIHAGPDDYRSDPAGAAGPRVACGVIEPR